MIFHGGTRKEGNKIITNGGRVITIVGLSEDIKSGKEKVYSVIESSDGKVLHFEGEQHRKDIAKQAIR